MVAQWIRHLLRLTTAQSLRLCTWWIHSAVPAGKRFIPVYRLAMDATRQGDDVAGWKSGACSGISSRHSIKGSSEPFASSARGFSGFCLSFIRSIFEHFARSVFRNQLMAFKWINSWTLMFQRDGPFVFRPRLSSFHFRRFRHPKRRIKFI